MESIGLQLKQKREEKGLSYDDIYEDTAIIKEHLEALEKDDFLHFPNKVYARSFLRDYANYLCLDSYKLLREFEEEYAKLKAENEPEVEETNNEPPELPKESNFLKRTVVTFLVFIILCAIAYFLGKTSSPQPNLESKNIPIQTEQPTDNTFAPAPVKPSPAPEPQKATPQTEDKVAEVIAEADKKAEAEIKKEFDEVVIYAHRNVWVRVKVDGKLYFEGTIGAGQNQKMEVKKSVMVRGGEPSACQINLNGKSIGSLGTPGKPFDLTLNTKTGAIVKQ